jgi:hypothetical protein
MADDAYAKLTIKLAGKDPASLDARLRDNILTFYANLDLPYATKKDADEWRQTLVALDKLKREEVATQ